MPLEAEPTVRFEDTQKVERNSDVDDVATPVPQHTPKKRPRGKRGGKKKREAKERKEGSDDHSGENRDVNIKEVLHNPESLTDRCNGVVIGDLIVTEKILGN